MWELQTLRVLKYQWRVPQHEDLVSARKRRERDHGTVTKWSAVSILSMGSRGICFRPKINSCITCRTRMAGNVREPETERSEASQRCSLRMHRQLQMKLVCKLSAPFTCPRVCKYCCHTRPRLHSGGLPSSNPRSASNASSHSSFLGCCQRTET